MAAFETDLPTFTTILPFSKREVQFRPFRVKEEKVLLMANAGDNIKDVTTAVENIVEACTNGAVTAQNSSMFDVQHMWLQLRGKSISEDLDFYLTCACEHQTNMTVHIDQFKFRETVGHTPNIDMGGYSVQMRYPTFEDYALLYESDSVESVYDVVAACITKIITTEEVKLNTADTKTEFREFVDNITPAQFKKLEQFFSTMPVLEYVAKYVCKGCEKEKEVAIDGINNFFGS
jgi:hypothetical protein